MNYPVLIFIITLVGLILSAYFGTFLLKRHAPLSQDERDDLGVIVAASLTLLGLIIGFTFSMAVTRYDQRKNYEEEEANAIGTEYLRVNLLPSTDAPKIHQTLREYLDQRIAFYQVRDNASRASINATTSRLQGELWSAIESTARANPTPGCCPHGGRHERCPEHGRAIPRPPGGIAFPSPPGDSCLPSPSPATS